MSASESFVGAPALPRTRHSTPPCECRAGGAITGRLGSRRCSKAPAGVCSRPRPERRQGRPVWGERQGLATGVQGSAGVVMVRCETPSRIFRSYPLSCWGAICDACGGGWGAGAPLTLQLPAPSIIYHAGLHKSHCTGRSPSHNALSGVGCNIQLTSK